MPRRKKFRWVNIKLPEGKGGEIELSADEMEAIRLADVEGMNQVEAAEIMGISQPTLHRILREARRKIGIAVLESRNVKITGGDYIMRRFKCYDCGNEWSEPFGTGKPDCPKCNSDNTGRTDAGRGCGRKSMKSRKSSCSSRRRVVKEGGERQDCRGRI